jgi:outer membrane phospholipase A
VRRLLALLLLSAGLAAPLAGQAQAPLWLVGTANPALQPGAPFEISVVAPEGEALPDRIDARLRAGADERVVPLEAAAVAQGHQRRYLGTLPAGMTGPVALQLAGRESGTLILLVEAAAEPQKPGLLEALTGRRQAGDAEPPLSENDPMYFVVGGRRDDMSARFQLSFKYRLFDQSTGVGRDRPWLAGFYFGYTQTSLWDLSEKSRPFRDTSYRPALFWKWERTDDQTWIDGLRAGYEHESNGGGGARSRSIDTLFVRPEWRWKRADDASLEFTPKFVGYLDKDENPDIQRYRGYVDWRVRYDSGLNWITTAVARSGTAGKGSLLLDVSRRIRDLRFGPVGGYLHLQFFTGYGEDILEYNVRRESQIRIGFAIVP